MSRRAFLLSLILPAVTCCAIALLAGPTSALGWAATIAEAPAAAAGVILTRVAHDRAAARRQPTA